MLYIFFSLDLKVLKKGLVILNLRKAKIIEVEALCLIK
tara:strand:+ start:544 stop:657 length:114 start_codon:yes stop_codon:yes gene_type:complete